MLKPILTAATVLVALAACASPKYVVSDVTRYHTLSPSSENYNGKTFAIVAVSPEQEQSIAFRQFGDQINARLSALGMRQFQGSAPSGADYVVTLDYDVLGPTPDVRTNGAGFAMGFGYANRPWGGPGWGGGWGGGWGWGGGMYDPFMTMPQTDTRQMFTRRVEFDIYRGSTYASGPKQRVFEGRAISTGLNGQIEPVMPYMLDAVFKDFPGRSGASTTVSVEVPKEVELAGARTTRPAARSSY
jgi:hypothetical protein